VVVKKKSGKGPLFWNWKPFFTVVLVLVLGYIVYGIINPHPGYRKLEQQLDELKLPADWVEIGPRTGEKDKVLGLTRCRDIDISCPRLNTQYSTDADIKMPLDFFYEIITNSGYVVTDKSSTCADYIPYEVRCYVEGKKEGLKLRISSKNSVIPSGGTIQIDLE